MTREENDAIRAREKEEWDKIAAATLPNEVLLELAKKRRPPQEWYDQEDLDLL